MLWLGFCGENVPESDQIVPLRMGGEQFASAMSWQELFVSWVGYTSAEGWSGLGDELGLPVKMAWVWFGFGLVLAWLG